MQKIVGSILVITVCTALGFEKSRELQYHLKALEELKRIFLLIKSELEYSKAPISEILIKVCKKTKRTYQGWLQSVVKHLDQYDMGSLQVVWENSAKEYLKEEKLTHGEMEELCSVGNGLQHTETIDLYLNQLDYAIKNTREELKNKKKMYQALGVMCGIFLVIVLL